MQLGSDLSTRFSYLGRAESQDELLGFSWLTFGCCPHGSPPVVKLSELTMIPSQMSSVAWWGLVQEGWQLVGPFVGLTICGANLWGLPGLLSPFLPSFPTIFLSSLLHQWSLANFLHSPPLLTTSPFTDSLLHFVRTSALQFSHPTHHLFAPHLSLPPSSLVFCLLPLLSSPFLLHPPSPYISQSATSRPAALPVCSCDHIAAWQWYHFQARHRSEKP